MSDPNLSQLAAFAQPLVDCALVAVMGSLAFFLRRLVTTLDDVARTVGKHGERIAGIEGALQMRRHNDIQLMENGL